MSTLKNILETAPDNLIIFDSFVKADSVTNRGGYKSIQVAVSGGSDSDVVMDIIKKVYYGIDINFVYFDTGIEFQGTKDHLDYLEKLHNTKIHRVRAIKPIPVSVREYGSPFISKRVSEMISRLQAHNFDFANADSFNYDQALICYPKCMGALKWFYNWYPNSLNEDGSIKAISSFNIDRNKYLREFLISNPPSFKISNKCCHWAKKKVAEKFQKENNIDLNIIGVRKSEGGNRATKIQGCYDRKDGISNYRPIFFYKNADKLEYNEHYNIVNSICYSKYGMSRTGCAGCPYAKDFEEELKIIKNNEPKLFKAVNNIFGESYKYTREFNKFKAGKSTKFAKKITKKVYFKENNERYKI